MNLLGDLVRLRRGFSGLAAVRSSKEMCHCTKRTHFDFDYFSIYEAYRQRLASFAERFANGFVFQNEPVLEGI
jgi:hypothetical protein